MMLNGPGAEPRVGVFIVNYNSVDQVEACISSLRNEPVHAIYVIDNSNNPAELSELRRRFDGNHAVRIVHPSSNVGFGAGMNFGIRLASERDDLTHYWMLNPDTRVEPGSTDYLLQATHEHVNSVVSPLITTTIDNREVLWFAGGQVDLERGTVRHSQFGRKIGDEQRSPIESQYLSGAAPFLSRAVWESVGGFSEDFFLYWEDVEFSLRCSSLGIGLIVDPRARVWHQEGGTSGGNAAGKSAIYYRWMSRNRIIVMSRFGRRIGPFAGVGLLYTIAGIIRPIRSGESGAFRKSVAALHGTFLGVIRVIQDLGRR
jgi:N-acetylglucosaminyl-diphospho-decaprenol L-rhamnosyltransferase